jgi:excisionase family DNA binding protein
MATTRSAARISNPVNGNQFREYVLGPEEVARILDRSPNDVAGLARAGKLRARRMGTRWKFRRDDVVAFLAGLSQIDKST